jgi:hypothetical protein
MFIQTLDANQWNYKMIGKGETWLGFQNKINGYLLTVSKLPERTLVVLSDARDVLCMRCPDAFKTAFLSFGERIIISAEMFCEGHMDEDRTQGLQCIPLTNYWKHYTINVKPFRKFANAGLIAGYAKDLKTMFTWILENNYKDDQLGVCNYVNNFPEKVYMDIHAEILHTTSYAMCGGIVDSKLQASDSPTLAELLGSSAFFLHIPNQNGSKGQKFIYDSVCDTLKLLKHNKLNVLYERKPSKWNEKNNTT